jgi:Protein of unknown function (DUF4197)
MSHKQMSRRVFVAAACSAFPLAAAAQTSALDQLRGLIKPKGAVSGLTGASLSQNEIGLGLKDALKVASQRVVGRVGKADGYNGDPAIRIPLPDILQRIESPLRTIGAGGVLDNLRLKMNRAAEQAAPKALDIFVDAASRMTFDDARTILTGPQDSATQYFRRTTSGSLTTSFRPIVNTALSSVGAVMALNLVQTRARGLPLVGQTIENFSLTDFTVARALDGLFHYLAVEEAAIRSNPVARTTDLLKKVFG